MIKSRNYNLDILRVIATIMVIIMHSPFTTQKLDSSITMWLTSYLTAPCIGLFFMISGSLLIPTKDDLKSFIFKRLKRILIPTIIWSLFYLFVAFIKQEIGIDSLLISIISIPIAPQGHGIMWFMYTLIGCYLIIPIVSPYILRATKKQIELILIFWIITLCYPYLQEIINIQHGAYNPLYYFGGFFGYMILGYYLSKYPIKLNIESSLCIGGEILFISILPVIIFYIYNINYHDFEENPFWYLSISVAIMCIAWFVLIQNINIRKENKMISNISKLSFGIYFIHIFIMRELLWKIDFIVNLPVIIEITICSVITFISSYLIVFLISKLKFSKQIIGI